MQLVAFKRETSNYALDFTAVSRSYRTQLYRNSIAIVSQLYRNCIAIVSQRAGPIIVSCIFQVMDTSGVPPRGFLHGDNFWLGDEKSCYILSENTTLPLSEKTRKNNSIYRNPNEEFPPFQLRFFIGRMWHNSTVQYHIETEKEVSTWIFYSLYLSIARICSCDDSSARNARCRIGDRRVVARLHGRSTICPVEIIHRTRYELLSS